MQTGKMRFVPKYWKLVRSLVKLPNRHPTLLVSEASGLIYRYVPNKFKVKIIYHVEEEQAQQVIMVRRITIDRA